MEHLYFVNSKNYDSAFKVKGRYDDYDIAMAYLLTNLMNFEGSKTVVEFVPLNDDEFEIIVSLCCEVPIEY